MGTRSSSVKQEKPGLKPRMICELDPTVVKNTRIQCGYYFEHKFYLLTEYSSRQQVIVVNIFTAQHRSLAITNLPENIYRPWLFKFMLLHHQSDGTLLGVVELRSDDDTSSHESADETIYYYSVLLNQTKCRVLELIQKFSEDENDGVFLDLTSRFRFVYRRRRSGLYYFTVYEISVGDGKPVIKEVTTFNHPDHLGGISTSGHYVTAYPHPLAKERGNLYVRNSMTDKWNFLELPDIVRRGCMLRRLDGYGETAKYTLVINLHSDRLQDYHIITLEMDTNKLYVVADKKIEFYGTECTYFKAADENTIISFNRTFDFGRDPKRPCMRLFHTGKFLIHRITLRNPEKLMILAFLASRIFVASSQIKLPESFPIQLDGDLSKSTFQNMFEPQNFQIPKFPQGTFFRPAN